MSQSEGAKMSKYLKKCKIENNLRPLSYSDKLKSDDEIRRTLYVKNIQKWIIENDLKKIFSEFGTLTRCDIINTPKRVMFILFILFTIQICYIFKCIFMLFLI